MIRSRDLSPQLLATVFWANVVLGALGTLLLVLAAPAVALFYHQPVITAILRVLALSFVISGLSNLHKALLERELTFRVLARVELLSVLAGSGLGIGLAVVGAGVWALVAQSLATTTLMTVLLWGVAGYLPTLDFSWREVRSIGSFSLNLTGYNMFNYMVRNADNLLVGRFLGATPLGIYALAYRIMIYPLQSVTTVISRVMYPVYASIQNDDARFRAVFARAAGLIALVTFPLMMGVWALARPLILTVFGTQWADAIPLVRILAPLGMVQSIVATSGIIFQAKGRTDVLFGWGFSAARSLSLLLPWACLGGLWA